MSMKSTVCRSLLLLLLLVVISLPAVAQKVEIFGGYQYTYVDNTLTDPRLNGSGWNASLTGNFKHVLGITADFSGGYQGDRHFYTYTFGPVLTARLPVVQPFVHFLFGGMTKSDGASNIGFAMLLGGGLDIGLRKGIGFRLVQADWMSLRFNGDSNSSNGRVSAGIVIKF